MTFTPSVTWGQVADYGSSDPLVIFIIEKSIYKFSVLMETSQCVIGSFPIDIALIIDMHNSST